MHMQATLHNIQYNKKLEYYKKVGDQTVNNKISFNDESDKYICIAGKNCFKENNEPIVFHNPNGPAIITDEANYYMIDGKLNDFNDHPAVEFFNGDYIKCKDGYYHCDDGPAFVTSKGDNYDIRIWYYDGYEYNRIVGENNQWYEHSYYMKGIYSFKEYVVAYINKHKDNGWLVRNKTVIDYYNQHKNDPYFKDIILF